MKVRLFLNSIIEQKFDFENSVEKCKGKRRENETRHFETFVIIFFPSLFFAGQVQVRLWQLTLRLTILNSFRVTYEVEKG